MRRPNMKFLLDTNFLLIPAEFGVDIFSELGRFGKPELFTLDLVLDELRKLASGQGKASRSARLALELVGRKGVKVMESNGSNADSEIERIAGEQEIVVCTQDRELQERLCRKGVMVVIMRQRGYLERL
jgi:rRNA-processing protein FCF1